MSPELSPKPSLTPFVSALLQRVDDAARVLLAVPQPVPVHCVVDRRGLHETSLPNAELGVSIGKGDAHCFFALRGVLPSETRAERIGLRVVERGPQAQEVVRGAKVALRAEPSVLGPRLRVLMDAIAAWWPYRGLRDEEFRKVSSSPEGSYGTLRLGYRCNQNCRFCWQDRAGPPVPDGLPMMWLEEMAAQGVTMLNITGGEPTTYADLPVLLARAHHDFGMSTSIQTNAIALASPRYLARLVSSGLQAVSASYHSADAGVSDEMTDAPGTFVKTVAGIQAALAAGLVVSLTCVVDRRNVDGLAAQAASIVERFVRPFPTGRLYRVTYAHPTEYASPGDWARYQVPFDISGPNVRAAARLLRAEGVTVQITGTCGFPLCILAEDPELLAAQPLHPGLFDIAQRGHLRSGSVCAICVRRSDCFGLRPEYLSAFGERGVVPFL